MPKQVEKGKYWKSSWWKNMDELYLIVSRIIHIFRIGLSVKNSVHDTQIIQNLIRFSFRVGKWLLIPQSNYSLHFTTRVLREKFHDFKNQFWFRQDLILSTQNWRIRVFLRLPKSYLSSNVWDLRFGPRNR